MGEDEAEKQAAEAIEILKNTIIGSSNDLEIEESISALYTLVSVYRLKPAGIQAFQLMGVAKIRLGNMLVQRITNLLDEFKKTKAIERLNEASGYASRIPEPSMREACNSEIAELRNEHGIEEPLISDSRKEGPSRPTGRSR